MCMKSPALPFNEFFCGWFGNVMQQCRPAQPKIIGVRNNAVKHLKRMIKIVFMSGSIDYNQHLSFVAIQEK
jgi:hypothetical protein